MLLIEWQPCLGALPHCPISLVSLTTKFDGQLFTSTVIVHSGLSVSPVLRHLRTSQACTSMQQLLVAPRTVAELLPVCLGVSSATMLCAWRSYTELVQPPTIRYGRCALPEPQLDTAASWPRPFQWARRSLP